MNGFWMSISLQIIDYIISPKSFKDGPQDQLWRSVDEGRAHASFLTKPKTAPFIESCMG